MKEIDKKNINKNKRIFDTLINVILFISLIIFILGIFSLKIDIQNLKQENINLNLKLNNGVPTILTIPESFGEYYETTNIYFTGYVYNFGKKEAKDLILTCKFSDLKDNYLGEISENIQNIASESYFWYNFDISKPNYYDETNIQSKCIVSSCESDCNILDGIIK